MGAHTQPTARRGSPRRQDTLAAFQAVCPGETHIGTPKEAVVLYTEIVNQIARRLPHRTRRDVSEITDMLIDYWREELAADQTVSIPGIGKLQIDRQTDGRVYGRFRPTKELKEQKCHE
jgi:nucleoid DNA-binding protein